MGLPQYSPQPAPIAPDPLSLGVNYYNAIPDLRQRFNKLAEHIRASDFKLQLPEEIMNWLREDHGNRLLGKYHTWRGAPELTILGHRSPSEGWLPKERQTVNLRNAQNAPDRTRRILALAGRVDSSPNSVSGALPEYLFIGINPRNRDSCWIHAILTSWNDNWAMFDAKDY